VTFALLLGAEQKLGEMLAAIEAAGSRQRTAGGKFGGAKCTLPPEITKVEEKGHPERRSPLSRHSRSSEGRFCDLSGSL